MLTICNGAFKTDVQAGLERERPITLFIFNMTVVLQGELLDGSTTILKERDATLRKVMKVGTCEQVNSFYTTTTLQASVARC